MVSGAEQLQNETRELLVILSSTLWVLEHPEVNAIRFAGNPGGLAKQIRARMAQLEMTRPSVDIEASQI